VTIRRPAPAMTALRVFSSSPEQAKFNLANPPSDPFAAWFARSFDKLKLHSLPRALSTELELWGICRVEFELNMCPSDLLGGYVERRAGRRAFTRHF
jgi:hypothetical protein